MKKKNKKYRMPITERLNNVLREFSRKRLPPIPCPKEWRKDYFVNDDHPNVWTIWDHFRYRLGIIPTCKTYWWGRVKDYL